MKRNLWTGAAMCFPFCIVLIFTIVLSIRYDIACGDRLKRAADANTVELAEQELSAALSYLENTRRTSGYTSVLYKSPDEDIGFWYSNLRSAREELRKVTPETSQLERTNVLMKLRETLLDSGDQGQTKVTKPYGISRFPNNRDVAVLIAITLILASAGVIVVLRQGIS